MKSIEQLMSEIGGQDNFTIEDLPGLFEAASPAPWHTCHGGDCSCKQVWTDNHPVAVVEHGEWGDTYPSLRLIDGGEGSIAVKVEASMEKIPYGMIPEEVAKANVQLIVALRNLGPGLLAENRVLRMAMDISKIDATESRLRRYENSLIRIRDGFKVGFFGPVDMQNEARMALSQNDEAV